MWLKRNREEEGFFLKLALWGFSLVGYVICFRVIISVLGYWSGVDKLSMRDAHVFLFGLILIWLNKKYGGRDYGIKKPEDQDN
ncbi:MAG: hypothetical protein HZA22_13440 [Nitrospirae bacterium]|nr:hypothetical protein [Nitrospirota bacterium]